MNEKDQESWLCPACGTDSNSYGGSFSGCRAVALHIAGKARTGDTLHKSWALNKVGDSINEPSVKQSINTLADVLEWHVEEAHKARRKLREQEFQQRIEPDDQAHKYIREIEKRLHQFVHQALQESLGEDEDGWWVKGIPPQIRAECAKRREEDSCREEAYSYTYLIDLKTIIGNNWRIFEPHFQAVRQQKGESLDNIGRLNDLRNRAAHPLRTPISEEELSFLSWFYDIVRNIISSK